MPNNPYSEQYNSMARPTRTLLTAFAALTSGLTLGVAVIVLPQLYEVTIAEKALACIPANVNEPDVRATSEQRACLAEVMTDALRTDQIANIMPALEEYDKRAQSTCHSAGHDAGIAAYNAEKEKWIAIIQRSAQLICNSALLHGVFTAAGASELTENQWEFILNWCDTLNPLKEKIANCGDAIGHAAWDQFKEAKKSVLMCEKLSTELWRSECSEGVLMQRYAPVVSDSPEEELPENLTTLCDHVDRNDNSGIRRGCMRGIGYVLAASVLQNGWDSGQGIKDEDVNAALIVCSTYSTADQRFCEERFMESFVDVLTKETYQTASTEYCPLTKTLNEKCEEILSRKFTGSRNP
jgi:hypothetical protein